MGGDQNGFGEWGGYMAAKITKLEEQFSAASDPFRQSELFAGISIYVNGLTNPSSDELKRIMMMHGGTFHHYERSHTTYIIASNLPDVKVRNMNTSKFISPQWVVDCLREKRIIDYTRYLLYTNQKTSQPRIQFISKSKTKIEQPKAESESMTPKETETKVSEIMYELEQLNTKLRQSLTGNTQVNKNVNNEQVENVNNKQVENVNNKQVENVICTSTSASNQQSNQQSITDRGSGIARTAVDPKFLSEFYNNSRLHHIATLGAGFKQYVNELREKHGQATFPARVELLKRLLSQGVEKNRCIEAQPCVMHIDMDCFFVSVGLRKHPHLRGHPIAVTHSRGGSAAKEVPVHPEADRQAEMEMFAKRFEENTHDNVLSDKVRNGFDAKMSLSEIASCSYEARAKGIRNGMFVGEALKLCPELKTIQYDFEGYKEVAYTLYNIIAQYTLNIEAVSCDEMFVDLSSVLEELKVTPMQFVSAIREEVRERTRCPCSAGVGANKLQARMATKRAKPDGQYHLCTTDVEAYMADIPIRELPGVGSSTSYNLREAQLITCGDLQKVSLAKIQMHVGKKLGETLHQFCRGIDNRPLSYGQVRKSVSAEVNYGIRFAEYAELETFLRQLSTEVHTRLNDIKRKTKCMTLKLMVRAKDAPKEASKFMGHGVCDNVTKSVSLSEFTNDLEVITRTVLATMKSLSLPPNELRGIGIQLSKLDDPNEVKERKENVIKSMFEKVVVKQKDKQQSSSNEVVVPIERKNVVSPNKRKASGPPAKATDIKRPNIIGMLQNAPVRKQVKLSENLLPSDIDPEVFAELPDDIKEELLQQHKQTLALCSKQKESVQMKNVSLLNESDLLPSTSKAAQKKRQAKAEHKSQKPQIPTDELSEDFKVDTEFLAALPPELRAEIEMDLANRRRQTALPKASTEIKIVEPDSSTVVAEDNIFAQKNCIELILAWVKSCDAPENYDVHLLCSHARELVRSRNIDRLYDALLYMCRLLNSQRRRTPADCVWHMAYQQIINAVQSEMRTVYEGNKLFLGDQLKCDKCCTSI